MVAIALLSIPAYALDTATNHPAWRHVAAILDATILIAFCAETAWMARISSFPVRYVVENWLNLIIIAGSFASLLGSATEGIALVRVLRVVVAALIVVRTVAGSRVLFTRRGAPLLVGVAVAALLAAGGLLYWLEPTVGDYWDGLWLAFVTATTIGYGDIVPTSPAARIVSGFVVVAGWAMLSLFTANVVAFFVGREERELRTDLHRQLVLLREELARQFDTEEVRVRRDIHGEMRALHDDIRKLRAKLDALEAR